MSNDDTTCLICFEDYLGSDNRTWLIRTSNCECQKLYHLKCFLNWYKEHKECPICHNKTTDNDWQVMVYHNNKWKMIPFSFITDMVSGSNFFNTVVNIEEDRNQDDIEYKSMCKLSYQFLFFFSLIYNFILSFILFINFN